MRGLVVRPLSGDRHRQVERSRQIVFRGDTFTAKDTEFKVGLRLDYSSGVLVRNSTFSHCGDRTPKWSTCLLPRWAADMRIVRNWFHDCRGCDFIGGRIGAEPGHPREPLRPRAGVPHGLGEVQPTRT